MRVSFTRKRVIFRRLLVEFFRQAINYCVLERRVEKFIVVFAGNKIR
jgi:hypothetical protein